jgi:hypothetical protein
VAGPGDQDAYRRIAERARSAFHGFARMRAVREPGFLERMRRSGGWRARLSTVFAWLPAGGKVSGRRYVFLSGRYAQLLAKFAAAEAVLVGNQADARLARRLGLPFRFTGNLFAASSAILFGMRGVPSRRIVEDWIAFFSRQADPCYLVVPNDTLPISTLLAKIANACANVRVVCVQHGLFNSGLHPSDIDGANSDFNLVFDRAQAEEMLRRNPQARVEAMGFPTEIVPVAAGPVCRAILVGVGTYEDLRDWEYSLRVFARVHELLVAASLPVEYRPHPSERPHLAGRVSWPMSAQPTAQVLSGERKAFIGFCSTLLYEAALAGHVVVVLDDPGLPGYSIDRFAEVLPTTELARLPALLESLSRQPAPLRPDGTGLRERFESALARVSGEADQLPGRGA